MHINNPENPTNHRVQRISQNISNSRRLAGSPLLPSGLSQKPRIGLALMRCLAALLKSPGGFWEFFRNTKMNGF